MTAADEPLIDIHLVITVIVPAIVDLFGQRAGRREPLTTAAMVKLERLVRLQLKVVTTELRARLTADAERMAAEQAHWAAVELPHTLRATVHRQRHGGKPTVQ